MTFYILASGQSNMMGRGTGSSWSFPPNLKVWDNTGERDDNLELGSAMVYPTLGATPFVSWDANNLAAQAAGFYARTSAYTVRLVLSGKGGLPISHWHDGTTIGPQLTRLLAVVAASGVTTPFNAFLWHQGESGTSVAGFMGMVDTLRSAGALTSQTPILVGTVAPQYSAANAVIEQLPGEDPAIRIVRVGGLGKTSDGFHFTGQSLVRAGLAYAGEMALAGG